MSMLKSGVANSNAKLRVALMSKIRIGLSWLAAATCMAVHGTSVAAGQQAVNVKDLTQELEQNFQLQSSDERAVSVRSSDEAGPVVRFELASTAGKIANGWRVEYKGKTTAINSGKPVWYVFSYFQTEEWRKWKKPVAIGQIHTAQPGPITVPPPLGLIVKNGVLNITLHSTSSSPLMIPKDQNRFIPRRLVQAGPARPGAWTCVLVRAIWSSVPGQGELAVWRDQKQLIDDRDISNAYPTPLGMYPKVGLYAYDGLDGQNMVLDADVVRVLDGQLNLDQVRARSRCSFN
jgi:hypothetical protein